MANLNVTYDQMQTTSTQLRSGQADLEAKLGELRGLVAQLVLDGFTTSAASGAFDASYEQFTAGAKTAVGGLEGMAQFLSNAAAALQSTDEQLAGRLGS
ncbi:MAG TPA: WXG100 family type VII secretion target [Microbacteriaceae bacterium]|nr:WXG100 family type VII secretion target [Microbacteriaceae bacterium]